MRNYGFASSDNMLKLNLTHVYRKVHIFRKCQVPIPYLDERVYQWLYSYENLKKTTRIWALTCIYRWFLVQYKYIWDVTRARFDVYEKYDLINQNLGLTY